MKKVGIITIFLLTVVLALSLSSCNSKTNTVIIDTSKISQTIEGFGASGAWWAQDVGGWTDITSNGNETRDEILSLLYGENGIGLNIYRYNLGAGGSENDMSNYSDEWRKTQSFIRPDGAVDYSLDANAVWCLKKASQLGCDDVVVFSNSAPYTMTTNGKTHCDRANPDSEDDFSPLPNLTPEKYSEFADYAVNASDYLLSQGIPVKSISPINEPQWKWTGGQEGCHYTPEETVAIYKAFLERMNNSPFELDMFDSGKSGDAEFTDYLEAIMGDTTLKSYFTTIGTHSYWETAESITATRSYLDKNYKNMKVESTEWCQMVNGGGKDLSISSALVLANTMHNDLTILNSVSWTYWIAVSAYDYKDGLIYVDRDNHTYETTKRLYAMGNYSKFIDEGMQRVNVELSSDINGVINASAYYKNGKTVIVFINNGYDSPYINLDFVKPQNANTIKTFVTDCNHNLEKTTEKEYKSGDGITLTQYSVTTVVIE